MTATADNNRSTFVYACYRAMQALERVKTRDGDVHDGCSEDEIVGELYGAVEEAVEHFDAQYLDTGMWHAGVYDYDVWDSDSPSAQLMYELLVYRAIHDAGGGVFDFYIGSITEIIDAYAASNGWKPGAGGE